MAQKPDKEDVLPDSRNVEVQVTKSRISKAQREALRGSQTATTKNRVVPAKQQSKKMKNVVSSSASERGGEFFVAKQKLSPSKPYSMEPLNAEQRVDALPLPSTSGRQPAMEEIVAELEQQVRVKDLLKKEVVVSNPVETERSSLAAVTAAPPAKSKLSARDFNGVIAPVFTCFKNDGPRSLEVRPIQRYADWLHSHNVIGVMVNGIVGEGPSMNVKERRANLEYWHAATTKNNMLLLAQVGGAPSADVQTLAAHAENLGVSAVITLPETFYRPRSVDQLVSYCKNVASHCPTRPFLYYHIPSMTGVDLDMVEFCTKAEKTIPNFIGLHFSGSNLEMGQKCLRPGRVVLLGSCAVLASGLMSGFTSLNLAVANIRPEMVRSIWDAFRNNEMSLARERQLELNRVVEIHTHRSQLENWVTSLKTWFNKELVSYHKGAIYAGPARTVF